MGESCVHWISASRCMRLARLRERRNTSIIKNPTLHVRTYKKVDVANKKGNSMREKSEREKEQGERERERERERVIERNIADRRREIL